MDDISRAHAEGLSAFHRTQGWWKDPRPRNPYTDRMRAWAWDLGFRLAMYLAGERS
jgi:hypothetical protein